MFPLGGIRLSSLPAPRRAAHRRGLGLLRRGRPFQQIPWERHPRGNPPAPRAVSFLLRCRPSRDPRLRGAGCPMEGGLSSGRDTYGFPFQTLPFWNLGPQASPSRGRPLALGPIKKIMSSYLIITEIERLFRHKNHKNFNR